MTGMKLSKHANFDSMDRMIYIDTNLGFGKVVLEIRREDARECLTDTGVLMVKDLHEEFLITAFIARIDKVNAMYRGAGYDHIPDHINSKVMKNAKRHYKMQDLVKY